MVETYKNTDLENKSLRKLESEKIIAETKANKEALKKSISDSIIKKLNSKKGYKVRKYDELGLINKITSKGNHITFNNEADKICPGDIIRIIDGKVFRTHNGVDQIVGIVSCGFKKSEVEEIKEEKPAPQEEKPTPPEEKPTPPEEKPEETIENLSKYFKNNNLNKLDERIKNNELKLNINQFLSKYKDYIEKNLSNFKYKDKVILSISNRINSLLKLINERIAWVDEQIKKGNYKKEDRKKEIQNQRWIINSKLNDLFSKVNNEILPSAVILNKKINTNSLEKGLEIEKMFESTVLENGDFDKTILSGEFYDAINNSWSVIDTTNERHSEFMKKNGIQTIEEVSLLSEKDKDIETDAIIAYFIYVGSMLIPYVGLATSVPSDIIDLFSDEEGVLVILREANIIDKNYKMEKSYIDNILGGVSIILNIFGLQGIVKGKKIIKTVSILDKIELRVLKEKIHTIGNKMGISKENIDKIIGFLNKKNQKNKNQANITPKDKPNISVSDTLKYINKKINDSGFIEFINKKFKSTDSEIIKFRLERLKSALKSGLIGGLVRVGYEEFVDGSQNKDLDQKILDLLEMFIMGRTGGLIISAVKTGGLVSWWTMKKGGTTLIKTLSKLSVKKILIGSVLIGGGVKYFFYKPSEENTNKEKIKETK